MSDQTIRERLSIVETVLKEKGATVDKLEADYRGMDSIYESFISEIARTNENIDALREQNEKMWPIIQEIITVKGYGGIAWKILKWMGGILAAIIVSWHHIKEVIHWTLEHLFGIKP